MNCTRATGFLVGIAVLLTARTAAAQVPVSGRVVDESGAAVAGAAVAFTRGDDGRRVATDDAGRFRVLLPDTGLFEVRIERVGYGVYADTLRVSGPREGLEYRLSVEAVRVDPLKVEAEARRWSDTPVPASRSHLISGSEMAMLEHNNVSMAGAIRRLPGMRVRRGSARDRMGRSRMIDCYEVARRQPTFGQAGDCDPVVVIVDGIMYDDPVDGAEFLRSERISRYESIQLLTPTQAHQRFGMAAGSRGAILLFTRGRGPYISAERNH